MAHGSLITPAAEALAGRIAGFQPLVRGPGLPDDIAPFAHSESKQPCIGTVLFTVICAQARHIGFAAINAHTTRPAIPLKRLPADANKRLTRSC